MSPLVDSVGLPVGLQSSSAPSALPLTHPFGSLGSVQWLAISICIHLSQVLAEPLRGQPFQAQVCKYILVSTIVLGGFVFVDWIDCMVGQSLDCLYSFHYFLVVSFMIYILRKIVKFDINFICSLRAWIIHYPEFSCYIATYWPALGHAVSISAISFNAVVFKSWPIWVSGEVWKVALPAAYLLMYLINNWRWRRIALSR